MTFNKSKLLLIALSLVSTVLLTVLILAIYNIRVKNQEVSVLLNQADHTAKVAILAQSIRVTQKDAAEDIESFESFVLTDDKLVPIIESIEGAGRALNLDTSILSVGKVEDNESLELQMIRIVIETQGSWTSTFSFLNVIESLPNRVMIEESNFSKEETSWRSRIILRLYSFN